MQTNNDNKIGILTADGPKWFENREQLLEFLRNSTPVSEREARTQAMRDEWCSQWYD